MIALLRVVAASVAVSTAKRRVELAIHRTAVAAVAIIIATAGLGFLVSALWVWIAMQSTSLVASLVIGGVFLVIASLVYLIGAVLVKREPRHVALVDPGAVAAQIQTAAQAAVMNRPAITNLAIVAGVGYVLGRVLIRR